MKAYHVKSRRIVTLLECANDRSLARVRVGRLRAPENGAPG